MNRTAPLAAAIAATATLAPAFASAAPAEPVPTRAVSYAHLDLGSPKGQARLDRRIRAAAEAVCPGGDLRVSVRYLEHRQCVREAIARASSQRDRALAQAESARRIALATPAG